MHQLIGMELSATTSELRFTLDELVIKVRELFTEKGMAQVVSLILQLVDQMQALRHTTGQATPCRSCPCGHARYEIKDRLVRQLQTSVGTLAFHWRRLACRKCGKTWCPLREFLGLERWQSKSAELERIAVEVVSEQSYRRGSRHLAVAGEIPVAKSTLHRWVVESTAAEWEPPADPLASLMADGTGYRRRPNATRGEDHRGELKVLVGRTVQGQWKALGAWSGQPWNRIVEEVSVRADTVVCDGENGLAQSLARLANAQQRCPWHLEHFK